jgi:hypothetical protein
VYIRLARYLRNAEYEKAKQKEKNREFKYQINIKVGDRCAGCGSTTDIQSFIINHENGGESIEIKEVWHNSGRSFYRAIRDEKRDVRGHNVDGHEYGPLNLLCIPCHKDFHHFV